MKTSKLLKSAHCGLFTTKSSPDAALKFAQGLLPDNKAEVTTAVMVYANSVIHALTNNSELPDPEVCGVDIIDIKRGDTKGEIAARLYPNMVIDCAVPQHFINKMSRVFDDPARHFVTVYSKADAAVPKAGDIQMMDGVVMPITDQGIYMLACAANWS